MPFRAEQQAMLDHVITHHDSDGLMWSSCSCGFESRKRDWSDNWQVTASRRDGADHQRQQVAVATSKALGLK